MHDRPRAKFPDEGLLQVDFAENFICEGQDEIFPRVFGYLKEHGTFSTVKLNEHNERRHLDQENNILNMVTNNPQISTRRVSNALNVPHATVWRRQVQRLEAGDGERRMTFSKWVIRNQGILRNCLFTDEAEFTRDGVYNIRNMHVWAGETQELHEKLN
ncbi:unnamed protein product [Brassicogethes aeneus]|uniref:Uncharacterized protein n=1 Tax=Brassicogethes aeneus TaxID=1431903 RepID=A0A9P0BB90_BRAAE|nr:unnamed protein product [Brassicogethes aeneus]